VTRRKLKRASESPVGAAIRNALDVGPEEDVLVDIARPQFNRLPGTPKPGAAPADFTFLRDKDVATLRELGCAEWDEPDAEGMVLMLFPCEWYDAIPAGFPVDTMGDKRVRFERHVTSNDRRLGYLSYGVRVPARRSAP